MKRRKAFSVIEVLMVVSIGTFLLALVTMLMIRTLDSHRVIQGHLRNTFVHRDLNTVFHEDVHAAGHVSIEDSQLSIRIADQSITYTASKDGVERIEKRDGNIIREDSYYFSKFHSIEFEKSEKFGKAVRS